MNALAFAWSLWPLYSARAALVVAAIAAWWATQALLARRIPKPGSNVPLTDGVHTLTARWHARLLASPRAANALLISSSGVIDLLGLYLLGSSIFGPTIRPFLGLVVLFGLRQICQMLCPLPNPDGMIWRHPGVPALLVTYGTANDLFFSGHTAIAIFGCCTLGGNFGTPGIIAGVLIALFEVTTVLLLRAHYTIDVFTGLVCAFWTYALSAQWAPTVDNWLSVP
jgi:hypothetical protein